MKYDYVELSRMRESLLYCLSTVNHTGMCLVWICSLLFCKTATLVGTQYVASRSMCRDNTPSEWSDAIGALVNFRNEYVHAGTLHIKELLQRILDVDSSTWDALFDYIEAPANAIAVFHKWYDSGVIE